MYAIQEEIKHCITDVKSVLLTERIKPEGERKN